MFKGLKRDIADLHHRYQGEVQTSEEFSTAGRTVKSGLVAAAVVSSWTWAATLLQYGPCVHFVTSIRL